MARLPLYSRWYDIGGAVLGVGRGNGGYIRNFPLLPYWDTDCPNGSRSWGTTVFLCKSCRFLLFYFILLQIGEPFYVNFFLRCDFRLCKATHCEREPLGGNVYDCILSDGADRNFCTIRTPLLAACSGGYRSR